MQRPSADPDPESLWGPLLVALTRCQAQGEGRDDCIRLLHALARHRRVSPPLRHVALAIAITRTYVPSRTPS